jgi:glycosyltransferase involved in cell wall biosynthesis
LISIVIGIYNSRHTPALAGVLESVQRQTIDKEIILCETRNFHSKSIDKFCRQFRNMRYVFTRSSEKGENRGLARNRAAKSAEGDYLYFTDPDIFLHEPSYLSSVLEVAKRTSIPCLVQPRMCRLVSGITEFIKSFRMHNPIKFDFRDNCFYRFSKNGFSPVEEFRKYFEFQPYACTRERYAKFLEVDLKYTYEFFWRPFFHWGGFFCSKDLFERIGGYSVNYHGWGCEDTDLLWKLRCKSKYIPLYRRTPGIYVLHIEHPTTYDISSYSINLGMLKTRKRNGIDSAIQSDLLEYSNIARN